MAVSHRGFAAQGNFWAEVDGVFRETKDGKAGKRKDQGPRGYQAEALEV